MNERETLLRYERALDCVHCGLCLPRCPTYRLTGKETASPRGRILLMRAFAEGRLAESPDSIAELDGCLMCRACEPACPSGVRFGEMMEITRGLVEETPSRTPVARGLKRLLFRGVLPHPRRLAALSLVLRVYQQSGLRALLRRFGILHLFGRRTLLRDSLQPIVPPAAERAVPRAVTEARGERRSRVGYLVGCVAQELLPGSNRAAIRALARNGCEVHCPPERPCCGALALHFGDPEGARRQALATMSAFSEDLDAVVSSSAGCASAMKDYGRLLEGTAHAERARSFSARVRDWSEYVASLNPAPPRAGLPLRVALDDPCHLLHAQGIREAPRALLRAVPDLTLVELEGAADCCGAAGLFSFLEPERSVELLREKMQRVRACGAQVLVTANPGCQLHLARGAAECAPDVQVMHVADLLARAYERERSETTVRPPIPSGSS